MPDEAGCAIWPGITGLDVAGCGWATVAVGNRLGFQLGYLLAERRWGGRRTSHVPCCGGGRPDLGRDIDLEVLSAIL